MRRAQIAQLLDRRGAEGVAGGEHDRLAFGPELGRELADRRGLAGAVDADDEDHERPLAGVDVKRPGDGASVRSISAARIRLTSSGSIPRS